MRPEAWFVFTTHDREAGRKEAFWEAEAARWAKGEQSTGLHEYGDRLEEREDGVHFMHVPTVAEMEAVLSRVGFRIEAHLMRSELANESAAVREFSDDCRFWVVQRPAAER